MKNKIQGHICDSYNKNKIIPCQEQTILPLILCTGHPSCFNCMTFNFWTWRDVEKVADFIRRLEQMFKIAYGRDHMSDETQDALLHGQLQDRLKY